MIIFDLINTAVDWANLERARPPYCPSAKDIFILNESKLGLYTDDKAYRKVILTEDDQKLYGKWAYVSHNCYEEEIIDLLISEECVVSKSVRFIYSQFSDFFCNPTGD